MAIIKQTGLVAWVVGIAAVIGLTLWSGADLVGQAMASVGAGTLLVVLVRCVTVSVAGVGWWQLFPAKLRPALGTCVLVRFVREATNALLPLAQCGGDLIGARVLTFRDVPGPLAAASVIVDVLLQAATQLLFALCGLALLIALGGDAGFARKAAIGLAIAAPALGGFYLVQRREGRRIIQFVLDRLAGDRKWLVLGTVDAVYHYLSAIYAARSTLLASGVVHLGGWLIGTAEVMIALAFMGHPVGFGEALMIESLVHAVRGAAFAIPGALGAQEGGLVVLCAIFGIPPDEALALSLVKRVADVALGVPGLVAWQVIEGTRLRTQLAQGEGRPRS
jgi:putative membrane protein